MKWDGEKNKNCSKIVFFFLHNFLVGKMKRWKDKKESVSCNNFPFYLSMELFLMNYRINLSNPLFLSFFSHFRWMEDGGVRRNMLMVLFLLPLFIVNQTRENDKPPSIFIPFHSPPSQILGFQCISQHYSIRS